MNQSHTYYPAQFFSAVISMRKGIETNEAICDMIKQVLNKDNPLQIDKIQEKKETYAAFVQIFGHNIVPNAKFKRMIGGETHTFEKSYTSEDEALALVILDNNIERWSAITNKAITANPNHPDALLSYKLSNAEKEGIPPTKYTMGTNSNNNNLRSGWNKKGIKKYTQFLKQTKAFRDNTELFTSCKEHAIAQIRETLTGKKRKRTIIEDTDLQCSQEDSEEDDIDEEDPYVEIGKLSDMFFEA